MRMVGIIVRNTGIKPVLVKPVPRIPSQGFRGVMTILLPSAPFHVVVLSDIHDHLFADMLTALYTFASIPPLVSIANMDESFLYITCNCCIFPAQRTSEKKECSVSVQ